MENKFEQKIIELFLFHNNLKFSEIEKQIKIRSNKLAYYIKNLVKKGILNKNSENYSLSEPAEHLIPYLSDKKAVLAIILIHIGNKDQCFLYSRKKRPFLNYLSLPGGRLLIDESISGATKRLMKKFNVNASFKRIHSISLEHVKKAGSKNKIHSFLLIFVSATTKDKIDLINISKNRYNIIKSDYELLKHDLDKEIHINTLYSNS